MALGSVGSRIAPEGLDHRALVAEARHHTRHVGVLAVPEHLGEKHVVPRFLTARARLDAAEVDAFFVKDGERPKKGPPALTVAKAEGDGRLVVPRPRCIL